MKNTTKLANLLDAIHSVNTMEDGSVRIKWKSNVFHEVTGFYGTHSRKSQILSSDTAIHLNPDLDKPMEDIEFDFVEQELQVSIERNLKRDREACERPCGCDDDSN